MQPSMHTTPAETAPLGTTSTLGTQSHQSGATTETTPRYTSSTTHPTDTTSSYTSGNGPSSGSNYTTGANTGSTTASSTTAGPHKSDMANKLDPRVDSDLSKTTPSGQSSHTHGTTGTTSSYPGSTTGGYTSTGGTTDNSRVGPHSSDTANKADPRVDSDLDRNRTTGYNTTTGTSTTGSTTTPHTTHTSNTRVGPHGSDMANKVDPRVDSDLDNTRTGHHSTTGHGNTTTGPSYGSSTTDHTTTTGTTGHTGNTRVGPHDSNMANKADPRVDSDLDNTRTGYSGTTGTGHSHTTGTTHGTSTSTGHSTTHPHTATAGGVGGTTNLTSGPAPKTAGPHKSDLLNKLDPRVDSNRDGSKTLGADKGAPGNQ